MDNNLFQRFLFIGIGKFKKKIAFSNIGGMNSNIRMIYYWSPQKILHTNIAHLVKKSWTKKRVTVLKALSLLVPESAPDLNQFYADLRDFYALRDLVRIP